MTERVPVPADVLTRKRAAMIFAVSPKCTDASEPQVEMTTAPTADDTDPTPTVGG
jgi:hypothetical protein